MSADPHEAARAGRRVRPAGGPPRRSRRAADRVPGAGEPEDEVLADVRGRFDENRFELDQNFAITYSGTPSAISRHRGPGPRTFFVEWADESETGTLSFEREAVRMMASLLGAPDAAAFITTGGTESNLAALRLLRNSGGRAEPEIIAPVTMHFSFRLGAELMGIRLVEIHVGDEPTSRGSRTSSGRSRRTVGLVASAPGGSFGLLDPIEAFADLAWRKGLPLHVDAAFGGFILPFMRDLGYAIPPFDLRLTGVSTIMTDGHKLGLLPIATGFFLARDPDVRGDPDRADADPHDVIDEAGQPSGRRLGDHQAPRPRGISRVDRARPGAPRPHRPGRDRDPGDGASRRR